jgi:hypothetical protein
MRTILTTDVNRDKCIEMEAKLLGVQPVTLKSRMEQQSNAVIRITPTQQSQYAFVKNESIIDNNFELREGSITRSIHHPEREMALITNSLMFKKEFSPEERVMLYSKLHEGLLNENIKALDSLSSAQLRSFIKNEGLIHHYKQVSSTLYGSKNFANAPKSRLVEFLKERVMTQPDSEGNIKLISAPGGIQLYFTEADMNEILQARYGKDYATEVEAHMYGFDSTPGTTSGTVNYAHNMSRRLPIVQEQREETTLLTSIVAAKKESELPFKVTTRRKNVIEEEYPSITQQTSNQSSTSSTVMPRTPSREEAYEMPVQTERAQASNTRLAQTMDIMGLGGGF